MIKKDMPLHEIIEPYVRQEVKRITEEVMEEAAREVADRVRCTADKMALHVLSMYDVERMGERVVITVKKDA